MKDKKINLAEASVAMPAPETSDAEEEQGSEADARSAAFVENISAQLAQLMEIGLLKDPAEFSQAIKAQPELLQQLLDGKTVLEVLGRTLLDGRLEEARQEGLKMRKARNGTVPMPIKAASGTTAVDPANFTASEMKAIEEKLNRGEKVYLG